MMKEAAIGGQQPVIAHGQAQMELTRIRDDWQDQGTWDAFVESNVEGRFAHLYNYGMATECYGFRSQRICFVKGSEIVAVVPMALTRSLLFGRKLISQPFSEYGGLLVAAELDLDEIREIVGSLRAHIAKKCKRRGAGDQWQPRNPLESQRRAIRWPASAFTSLPGIGFKR